MTDYDVGDTFYVLFTTRSFATGAPTILIGTPVVSAYENADLTQITAGVSLGVDHDTVTGLNRVTVVATGGNGFEAGKDYHLVITVGTVGGVSVVGEVVGGFTLARSAAKGATDALNNVSTADVNAQCDLALSDINLDHFVGTASGIPALPAGTYLDLLQDDGTAVYDRTTDSLQAVRDQGDAAWTTGAGGSDRLLMVDTTITGLSTQLVFNLAAGSADNDAYNNCTVVIEDVSTATQKSIGVIIGYVGSTKTVTLKEAPAFTIVNTDKIYVLAENALKSTVANRQLDVNATGEAGIDLDNTSGTISAAQIATAAITAAKFGAAAITSTVLADNAITAAKLANDSIAAATIANGAIDANTFAAGAIDAAAIAADAGGKIRNSITGTSDSGSTTTMVDNALTQADTDYFKGSWIRFTSGNIDGQSRLITGFTPASDTVTFSPAVTNAVIAQGYEIIPAIDMWDRVLGNTTYSASALMQIASGVAAAKLSGAATTTVTIRDIEDAANLIVATVDSDGNRSAITITAPAD